MAIGPPVTDPQRWWRSVQRPLAAWSPNYAIRILATPNRRSGYTASRGFEAIVRPDRLQMAAIPPTGKPLKDCG